MKTALALSMILFTACTDDPAGNFLGTYQTTLTAGSAAVTETLGISEGETADLILTSQSLGSMRATIIGDTSFSIDQQQITIADSTGKAFTVTLQGQGTVSDGVLAASGQLSSSSGALSLTMNGSRQ